MPGRFYDDLLSGVNNRLGINYVAKDHLVDKEGQQSYLHPSAGDPFVDKEYKFAAAPKKGVRMEVKQTTESEWKQDAKTSKWNKAENEKTAAKLSCSMDCCDTEMSFCNDKMTMDVSGSPVDSKDYPMKTTVKTEIKQAKNDWKVKLLYDVSTPDMSGATFWQNFEVEHNAQKDWLISSKTNVAYEDQYHVGVHVQHDCTDFKKIRAQLVCDQKDNDSMYFIRADAKRNFVGAGCDNKLKDGIQHSWEGLYCWTDGWKGIGGQPVKIMGGVQYALGSTSNLTVQGELWDRYVLKAGATHKVDKNWNLGVNQRFDSSKVGGANPYDIGFSMTYKL